MKANKASLRSAVPKIQRYPHNAAEYDASRQEPPRGRNLNEDQYADCDHKEKAGHPFEGNLTETA